MININKEKEFVYIYNQYQSQFYFSKGILPVKVKENVNVIAL